MHILRKTLLLIALLLPGHIALQAQSTVTSIEYGASLHAGDHTPLWQNSLQHGLSSLDNNTYIRGGVFRQDTLGKSWTFNTGIDLAAAAGFTSRFIVHQAYTNIKYKWVGLAIGSQEWTPSPLNHRLSSGGMSWSGNARPIPQVKAGFLDDIPLTSFLDLKAEFSYGWATDNTFQRTTVQNTTNKYVKDFKYHHKSFFLRIGKPQWRLSFEGDYALDNQFGGYQYVNGQQTWDLGNKFKDYLFTFFPRGGGEDSPSGEEYFKGNFTGNEHFRFNYRFNTFTLSTYIENYYEDFSGMGKFNGMDGLWGLEYSTPNKQLINAVVLEYLQTTNQSGPLHGLEKPSPVKKTGGADNYYNHGYYPGWEHWGMALGNPLLRSPIYNTNHALDFQYSRVKAIHLGWSGIITPQCTYRAKLTYNQTYGNVFSPTLNILTNYSTFVEALYAPTALNGWTFCASGAFDTGDIYGDNLGIQLKINRKF